MCVITGRGGGVTLLDVLGKVLVRVLQQRLQKVEDELLSYNVALGREEAAVEQEKKGQG